MNTAAPPQSLRALLALGQARRPWDYIAAVARADAEVAGAPPVRFLLAANLGSLGFPDAALDLLDELDAQNITGLNTNALRTPLQSKPPATLDRERLTQTLHHNTALLNIPELRSTDSSIWVSRTGAVLWRVGSVFGGCDAQAHAASAIEQAGLSPECTPSDHLPPQLIAGLSTAHLLHSLLRATRPLTNGYTPRIFVVEPDTERAARALSTLRLDDDLCGTPLGERVTLFTGEDALDRLQSTLAASLDCALPRTVLLDPLAPTELAEGAKVILTDLGDAQRVAIDRELARIERETQTLDQAAARVRAGANLRVVIPVSRYSNFVQHSAADLAATLRSLGHEPIILAEPAPHTLLSRLGYLRAWANTNPDLVLSINHPRWRTSSALPERAPSICWVQDAMPHLFEDAATKQGKHDFIVGYRFHELTERFGYRADRVIDAVLPVSTEKFHDGPVDPELQKRFTCDVAFATRHSETPEAMRDRLRSESSGSPAMIGVIDHLFESLRKRIERAAMSFTLSDCHELTREALQAVGHSEPGPEAIDEVYRLVLMPLADRIVRDLVAHRTAAICDRRGWSFALYGTGWENHPTLARYARGELAHGEQLRAAYQCAGVHLHASAHSLIHQRVIECLFSGGRVLCYRRMADLMEMRWRLLSRLARSEPDRIAEDGSPIYSADLRPEVVAHLDRCARFGLTDPRRRDEGMDIEARFVDHFRNLPPAINPQFIAASDAVVDHASFASRDELEAMLELHVQPRQSQSAAIEQYHQTIRALAADAWDARAVVSRVLHTVAATLGGDSASYRA